MANTTQLQLSKQTSFPRKSPLTIAQNLAHILADTYTLYLKSQNYHWNVGGTLFYSLHELFEQQYKEMAEAIDEIAERIRILGMTAPGSFTDFQQLSSIPESQDIPNAKEMIQRLIDGNLALSRNLYSIIKQAELSADFPTVDLLTRRMTVHEKNAWMLKSILEEA